MLQMTEASQIDSMDNIVDYMHLSGEITKRAYNNRLDNIGDPNHEFSLDLNTDKTTSKDYAEKLIENFYEDIISDYDINDFISIEEDQDNIKNFVLIY